MKKTKYYSYLHGKLAKGCNQCVKGEKLVLFVTGLCSLNCFYCPISEQKYLKDVTYANEWPIKKDSEIIEEIKLTNARGAGFTGGDPLVKIDRTVKYIKLFKRRFGKKFHIHLYTPLKLVNKKNLNKLNNAELDELRLHPNIYDEKLWNKIKLAADKKYKWKLGIEIPAIPSLEKKTKKLIDYSHKYINFLNINELEVSDTNVQKLEKHKLHSKKNEFGVRGSGELAKRLLKYAEKYKLNIHYCTTKLKDKIQLANRIKRRAKNVKKAYDIVSEEGMLIRGAIYTKIPRKRDMNIDEKEIKKLENIKKGLVQDYNIPKKYIELDKKYSRILVPASFIENFKDDLKQRKLVLTIVEEYPTWDNLQVEVDII